MSFTLDDIRAAAEEKYGSTDIELSDRTVKLLNPLRLPKSKRDALMALQDRLKDEGPKDGEQKDGDGEEEAVDQEAVLSECIELVADTPANGKALLKAINGDLAMLVEIFNRYTGGTKAGEASPSDE